MQVRVLGSAAGGGFPQWNCNCANCAGLRRDSVRALRRTQSSIAVSGNGVDWLLCNASPDILQQIQSFPALQPARAVRDTGIGAVLLMDAQIDHTTGLYMLRESRQPLQIWGTAPVREDLQSGHPVLRVLEHFCGTHWNELPVDGSEIEIPGTGGLRVRALALRSKAPPYSPHRHAPVPGDNIGVLLRDPASGRRLFYAPGLGEIEPHVREAMHQADCVLVDGTFWTDDEMQCVGARDKSARALGHLPQSGPGGMIEQLDGLPAATRKYLIHINNTNPILREDSAERAELAAHGIEVCHDGLDIAV